jgi:hypothetical protein
VSVATISDYRVRPIGMRIHKAVAVDTGARIERLNQPVSILVQGYIQHGRRGWLAHVAMFLQCDQDAMRCQVG